jgi:hypothetical protein
MAVNIYTFVGMYDHALQTAAHILAAGAQHAAAKGLASARCWAGG